MNFFVSTADGAGCARVYERKNENGIILLDFEIEYKAAQIPSVATIVWKIPCIDMYSTWCAPSSLTVP